ncbi:Fe-S cluster assembly protein SufD [Alcaligenaceae bacterium CGII-47]|nr:Fe-S cluster assembly protein SufD [Alcaligenaceae bacterium CGII-47]
MSADLQGWTNTYSRRVAGLPGASMPWLAGLRQQAMDRFASEGWPTTRMEAWRHTSLAGLAQESFEDGQAVAADELVASLRQGEAGHWLVFVDGHFDAALSDVGALPEGVVVEPLSTAIAQHADEIEFIFGEAEHGESTEALNLALASDGALVRLARGVVLEQPVHLVFVAASPRAASFTRNVVIADSAAQATVVEHFIGVDQAANFTNTVTRLLLAQDARVTHLKLQQESTKAYHLGVVDVAQSQGSYFASHSMSLGARLARHGIATRFDGQRCETLLNGLYYVDGRRHVDHHTMISHAQPRCVSHEYYRGIMADASRGVFSGRILVSKGADGTDAIQRNDSLLLSRLAKSDSRPELEIYADDVKCAHGATVGQIDKDALFYLRSRGLDEVHARDVLTYAFAATSVLRIEAEPLRKRVEQAIRTLLPGGIGRVGEAA